MKIEKIIKDRLKKTRDCEFKKAFIPTGWAIVKINIFAEELAAELKQKMEDKKQLQAENEKLKKLLEEYGEHKLNCAYVQGLRGNVIEECTCGFEQALEGKI